MRFFKIKPGPLSVFEIYEKVQEKGVFITREYSKHVATVEASSERDALREIGVEEMTGFYAVLRV
jgi:hypothetical protein